jgi:leucyl/phenylalanyl-tRNA--protein transferase
MQAAYIALHEQGYAHSVEIWSDGVLVGGLYGVALGKVFFGESMFSSKNNTSKLALVYLTKQLELWDFELIDCQVSSDHLFTLGAFEIPRTEFLEKISASVQQELHEANNEEKHNSQSIIGNWSQRIDRVKLQHEY